MAPSPRRNAGTAVPPQLLAAIGRVESGRRDPVTGAWGAWPWTINAEGSGSYFDTKAEAIQAVQALQARGVRSIDVGCMQVNLMHHPTAFPTLDMAFEPAVNADYAARFLVELHEQTGDWTTATADYHSSNPARAVRTPTGSSRSGPRSSAKPGCCHRCPSRPGRSARSRRVRLARSPATRRHFRSGSPPGCSRWPARRRL